MVALPFFIHARSPPPQATPPHPFDTRQCLLWFVCISLSVDRFVVPYLTYFVSPCFPTQTYISNLGLPEVWSVNHVSFHATITWVFSRSPTPCYGRTNDGRKHKSWRVQGNRGNILTLSNGSYTSLEDSQGKLGHVFLCHIFV
jgi:hypothetical protein